MDSKEITKITADLQNKYPDAGIKSIEVDESSGKATFLLDPKPKTLAYLENGGAVIPKAYKEKAAVITRDTLDRTFLDLAQKEPMQLTNTEFYEKAINYYYTDALIGSVINTLSNLATKGFEHDIDDENIKNFYDTWAFDVRFKELLTHVKGSDHPAIMVEFQAH